MKKTVAIIGGGVAGMSAAHEPIARSGDDVEFDVPVFERNPTTPGGKARSIPAPNTGTDGRRDLPGEHGFRFFPGFYQHPPDTMRRIPYRDGQTVADNLVVASRLEIARFDKEPIVVASRFPRALADLEVDLKAMFTDDLGFLPGEIALFAARIWPVFTSCQERRLAEYEKITWADFLNLNPKSSASHRNLLVAGLSRSLLANDPFHASARNVGDTNVQLFLGVMEPGHALDRLLNGPTSEVWLDPWLRRLEELGVHHHFGVEAEPIQMAGGLVDGVQIREAGETRVARADAYIFAPPVETMARLLRDSGGDGRQGPIEVDPGLAPILKLSDDVAWMNGIQFFLRRDAPLARGHTLYADLPWSLTSISEAQFWSREHLRQRGDGTVQGILSACISEWDAKGVLYDLTARECSRDQIAAEVWAQIKRSVNVGGKEPPRDEDLHGWFLDPDIQSRPEGGVRYRDAEPLFVNLINSWRIRPETSTGVANMFLASDYLRTNTDVACMEAANEAARRAVDDVLDWAGSRAGKCEIWQLREPALFAPFRWRDQSRFDKGLPWDGEIWTGAAMASQPHPLYVTRPSDPRHQQPYACLDTRL